jgi:hypothetical protein
MTGTRVRPQNRPNLGANHRRVGDPARICNDEWACFGASPFGPGYPRALGRVALLAKADALAAQRAFPSALGHPGAGASHLVNTL